MTADSRKTPINASRANRPAQNIGKLPEPKLQQIEIKKSFVPVIKKRGKLPS